MPATRIELYLSDEQIAWAKREAEKGRQEDEYTGDWRGVIEGAALSAIDDRINNAKSENVL